VINNKDHNPINPLHSHERNRKEPRSIKLQSQPIRCPSTSHILPLVTLRFVQLPSKVDEREGRDTSDPEHDTPGGTEVIFARCADYDVGDELEMTRVLFSSVSCFDSGPRMRIPTAPITKPQSIAVLLNRTNLHNRHPDLQNMLGSL
jgi:hypothetical protein